MRALYVTDRPSASAERIESILRSLCDAPNLTVELRERDACDREALERARRARALLGPAVPLYVNRRFDIALASGADGVHLPAAGLPLERVRANTPRGFGVGVSTHSGSEAIAAIEENADVVLLGPIFDTPSKRAFGKPLGPEVLGCLPPASTHRTAVYAIGGLDENTIKSVLPYRDRISGIAAVRLFQDSADPRRTVDQIGAL